MDSDKRSSDPNNSNIKNSNEHKWRWKPWSIVRSDYLRMALEADRSGDYDKGILYDSKALSCGFIRTFLNNDQQSFSTDNRPSIKTDDHPNSCTDEQQKTETNELIDYLSEYFGYNKIDEPKTINLTTIETDNATVETDDKNQFEELCTKCGQLPKQWNVVQLHQLYNGYNGFSTTKDVYTSDAPIKITLFCDSLSETRDNRPISMVLDLNELGEKSVSFLLHVQKNNYKLSKSS